MIPSLQLGQFGRSMPVSAGEPDPYFANVVLLLHMDGGNGSTVFVDKSPLANTVTAAGNAQVDTSLYQYGTGSLRTVATGDYLSATNSNFAFGTGDFTIEFWIYHVGAFSQTQLMGKSSGSPYWQITKLSNQLNWQGNSVTSVLTSNMTIGTWNHYAVIRSSSVVNTFLNGVKQTQNPNRADSTNYTLPTTLYIGSAGANSTNAYLDEVRITKGVARYIVDFVPPAAPFPDF